MIWSIIFSEISQSKIDLAKEQNQKLSQLMGTIMSILRIEVDSVC